MPVGDANGLSRLVVKELAGHASISTTQKYYMRILPEALRSAQALLPFGNAIKRASDASDTYHGPVAAPKESGACRRGRTRRVFVGGQRRI